jgi:hypothetical protein
MHKIQTILNDSYTLDQVYVRASGTNSSYYYYNNIVWKYILHHTWHKNRYRWNNHNTVGAHYVQQSHNRSNRIVLGCNCIQHSVPELAYRLLGPQFEDVKLCNCKLEHNDVLARYCSLSPRELERLRGDVFVVRTTGAPRDVNTSYVVNKTTLSEYSEFNTFNAHQRHYVLQSWHMDKHRYADIPEYPRTNLHYDINLE